MNRELSATSVTSVLPLVSTKSHQSEANDSIAANSLSPIRCRFANNSVDEYLWLIKCSQLDIISVDVNNVSNQRLFGSIDFSQVFNDNNIKILNVLPLMDAFESTSVNSKYIYTLIVSLRRSSGSSLLCLIDVRLSLILKTIETPFKITSLEVISSTKPNRSDNWPLIDELLQMNGIIAVGTEGGLVFLVDLYLDYETPLNEGVIPKKLLFISGNSSQINFKAKRKSSAVEDKLVCIPLNSDANHKNRFIYKAADGTVLSQYPKNQMSVTALHYIPQISMLCIGFNFGGFQFYNVKTFKLECSCGLEFGLSSVVRFAFQDPENDPKNYSYIWVMRGQEIEDNSSDTLDSSQQYFSPTSNAIMYSISFEKKDWIPDYGILYSGFQGCTCRFEYILGPNPHFPEANISCNSRLIDCYTIPLGNYSSHKSSDDESVNLDLSLLFIAWEAFSEASETNSSTYFAIFDLNQWYRSQMPTDVKVSEDRLFSPFIGVFSLNDIANNFSPDAVLAIRINRDSITKFRSQAFQDDIHYFPSALSFEVTVLSESQICGASYLGLPKRCLAQMTSRGPQLLIDPKEYVNSCITSGLLPYDLLQNTVSTQKLREIVLTVALENEYIPFLIRVIKEWSTGEWTHCGCDSKFILEWIWKKVSLIKNEIDSITYPLFNFSGQLLDNFNLSQLYAYETDLKSLNILLKELQTSGAPTTQHGLQELAIRREVTQLISQYLRILLWLYDCNLLPEHSEEDAYGEREVAYPSSQFKSYYTQRRTELHEINPSVIGPTDLLLIDGMVESMGSDLSSLWGRGGGDGLYPPPNLHSLVAMFLLDSVSIVQKQAIMLYSLLDLADFLSDRQSDVCEKIRLFPPIFGLKPDLTKMVQSFWGLDHKLFDFALRFLLDPVVKPIVFGTKDNQMYVFNDLQQRIVSSFLYQNEVRSALIYSQNCSQFALDTPLRERLHLNMLLVNQQFSKAFQYQRLCRNESNATELLFQLYDCCERLGVMEKIFKIPLDQFEEEVLTNYLLQSNAPNAKQMLVLYLIVNNKIIEASNVLNEFKSDFIDIPDKELAEKTKQLMQLMSAYVSALPQSLTSLAKEIVAIEEKKLKENSRITISESIPIQVKPKPLSYDWVAPSKAIADIMEQITHVWSKESIKPSKESTPLAQMKKSASKVLLCQNSPFLRTPTVDMRSAKIDKSLIKTSYPTPKSITFESKQKPGLKASAKESKKKTNSDNKLLSILETPQINRKPVENKSKSILEMSSSNNYFTPTSILKVKQMIRRSTSPSSLNSSPVSSKFINKTLESTTTPLQHKLRFSVPDKDISFTEEHSVENVRLASVKDTFLLKTLKNRPIIEETDEMEGVVEDSDLIDFDTTAVGPEIRTIDANFAEMTDVIPDHNIRHQFVFSPPQTRSSATKKALQKKFNEMKAMEKETEEEEKETTFLFSPLEEKKKTPKPKNPKSKAKKELKILETKEEIVSEEKTVEPMVRETPSRSPTRSPTPHSYHEDSDSHKSDTSHVSSSKASTRSSRSSRTPTKKTPKKVNETPTHGMKLRTSTAKPKKDNN